MATTRKPTPKPKAASPKKSSPETYTDPELRDQIKARIMAGEKGGHPGQWSARKSQLLAAEYKKAGGGYKTTRARKAEPQKHLDQWTGEKWTTADGEPAIREGETARYLPEKAWEELSPAEKKATDRKKKAGSQEGRQSVANTASARKARSKARSS